jgi:hypothetical protein
VKYAIGFEFNGLDPDFMKEKYLIRCEVIGYTSGDEYIIKWTALSNHPDTCGRSDQWLTTEESIDNYIKGYILFNTPLFGALKEDD